MTRKQLLNLPPYAFKGFAEITKSYKSTESYFAGKSYLENLVTDSEIYSKNPIHSFVANKLLETFLWDDQTINVSEMIDGKSYHVSFQTNIRQNAVQNNSGKTISDVLITSVRDDLLNEISIMSNSEKQEILLNASENYYYTHNNWFNAIYDDFPDPSQMQKQIDTFSGVISDSYFTEAESYLSENTAVVYSHNIGQYTKFFFKNSAKIPPLLSCSSINNDLLQHYLYAQIPEHVNENLSIDFNQLFSYASHVLDNLTYHYSIYSLLSEWGIAMIACIISGNLSNPADFASYLPTL